MEKVIQNLIKWGINGFNNHEDVGFKVGYIQKYFSEYLYLKKELLERRDSASQNEMRRYFNALRIYVYTLYENLWHGYITSHSEELKFTFVINGIPTTFLNPHQTHLPSFSSAILNFGTCRDLFFVLLKLSIDPATINNKDSVNGLLKIHYGQKGFEKDLIKLSNNSDADYVNDGVRVYETNEFRNIFAHKMRLLWWFNKKCSPNERFLLRKEVDAIKNKKREEYMEHIFEIFTDNKSYERKIENSNCPDLISSGEILRETHDLLARFVNKSYKFIHTRVSKV